MRRVFNRSIGEANKYRDPCSKSGGAAALGRLAVVDLLAKFGGITDILDAVFADDADKIAEFAAVSPELLASSYSGETLLHEAAHHGRLNAIDCLVRLGVPVDAPPWDEVAAIRRCNTP